jgi:AraC family transcriptional regulator of arabinose operon
MSRTVGSAPAKVLSPPGGEPYPEQRNSTIDPRVADALRFPRANCHNTVTVGQMALRAGLSRSRFAHLFRQQTGETFRASLGGLRLAKAAVLLGDCTLRMKEIATMCGYADSHSFGKAFRNRFGLMPSAYRRSTHGYQIAHRDTKLKLTA